ncbi:hypothetical protein H6F93_32360 [Leptolyngbya sp. FACHB-671]|uniref:hypothetical protein n=1 Tax=Leptolyngbya sp. FACHB-671 TaxID=2692812 RepID=UPI00168400ED|nr:hypothetical protein [Leptolyngbya sp. FACHB-671]MBD1869749.1 hypothetical protein [Cyanobacteria bacterium FACHB-471]MBD2072164.1 hypothetical protein [Leptolyngbya sp. FACHB-671]
MFNSSLRAFSPLRTLTHVINQPLAGLFLALGLAVSSSGAVVATEAPETAREGRVSVATAAADVGSLRALPDGVYLFGQSPEPDQVGAAYMVFEVNDSQVEGAFYMPYSSFDCFNGQFGGNQLELTVINSYEQTAHPYVVALNENSSVATTGNAIAPVGLEGYHQIEQMSENDERILATCQADLQ